ncbi:MAG TPA: penicillin-binding protein 2 [Candidatus Limnocylindrales bacterium]|nr:penicillin-binding protein 2 [Candidatus Limnocylindrales bacterium]
MADLFAPTPPRQRLLLRFGIFGLAVVLAVGVLTTRLFSLQVAGGNPPGTRITQGRLALQPIRSPRGLIYDRAGRLLAYNVPSYAVRIRPADLPLPQRPAVVARLSTLLRVPESQIIEALDRNAGLLYEPVKIASDVALDMASILEEEAASLPGVEVAVEDRRQYDFGPLVSHLLGYTGAVSAADLTRLAGEGYLTDDVLGKAGVESTFERELRGSYGVQQVERDGSGRIVRTVQVLDPPAAGHSLELTIDVEIQRDAEEALRWGMEVAGLERGVVIAMNPQTGEILAMVSLPAYDNNLFARGISQADYQALLNDPTRPLINQAIAEQYPPGSTYKLITGTGALEDDIVTPRQKLETAPYLEINGYRFWEWNRKGFGPMDIYDAFGRSAGTYFFQLAGRMGIDRLAYWGNQFGFGERTGIDLPGEVRGIIPTDKWKREVFNQPIYPGEVYQAGIGQGYNTSSVLQVINAYAALANGGHLFKPQIVRRVLDSNGGVVRDFEPELIHELEADDDVLRQMRLAARRVVTIGHTGNLVDMPFAVAGKTGTAEFGLRDEEGRLPIHYWFTAFVPKFGPGQPGDVEAADSELAVVAFAYDAKTRGNAATEIVKYFLQLHYDLDVDLRRPELLEQFGGR